MFAVLADTSTGNNIPAGTRWMKKVDTSNNGSTAMLVKLDVDWLIYQNIPLKDVTNVDILNSNDHWAAEQAQILWQSHKERDK